MLDNSTIAKIRREYQSHGLLEHDALPDPIAQFSKWLHEATEAEVVDATAMVLSTSTFSSSSTPMPSSRVVLLKTVDPRGFVFFTNYNSRKGNELEANPNASLLFFWHELTRQVRIEGAVDKVSREESETYFKTRPYESQLAAWASAQGEVLHSRHMLTSRFDELKKEYHGREVPIPPHWGGYVLAPTAIEFWAGRENRLHDRLLYTKEGDGWTMVRLAP